jgi:hypothetical protein
MVPAVIRALRSDDEQIVNLCLSTVTNVMRHSERADIVREISEQLNWPRLVTIVGTAPSWTRKFVEMIDLVGSCPGMFDFLFEKGVFEALIKGFDDCEYGIRLDIGSLLLKVLHIVDFDQYIVLFEANVFSVLFGLLDSDREDVVDRVLCTMLDLSGKFIMCPGFREMLVKEFMEKEAMETFQRLDMCVEKAVILTQQLGLG